jgi:hypothetical protein
MEQHSAHALARVKHGGWLGGKEIPSHYVWRSMIARCTNSNNASFKYYGGKGVKVCKRWLKYENFLLDMGERPSPAHSLDRIHTAGDYKPSNCKWSTRSEQQKNKTTTRLYTDGVFTGTLVECAALVGISKALAHIRWKAWGSFQKERQWRELQKRL